MMKYIKPDMDIIEFDENIRTVDVGPSGPYSSENNGSGTDLGNPDLWG